MALSGTIVFVPEFHLRVFLHRNAYGSHNAYIHNAAYSSFPSAPSSLRVHVRRTVTVTVRTLSLIDAQRRPAFSCVIHIYIYIRTRVSTCT